LDRGVCTFEYLRNNLLIIQIDEEAKSETPVASFSDEEIKRVLGDIALQIGEVYALKSTGSINDDCRTVVVDMFRTNPKLKKENILTTVSAKTGKPMSNSTFTKIMKELAVSNGNLWVLKTGTSADR